MKMTCLNCTHCVSYPNHALNGYYCTANYDGDILDADHSTTGVEFLGNQPYERGLDGCINWEQYIAPEFDEFDELFNY